jgi:DNA-binding MarR family transcriptional regulator
MNKYTLSIEGKARFKRMRIRVDLGIATTEGYEVLDYLYEHGSATVEEIENDTGLSRDKVSSQLSTFIHHGFIEGIG